MKLIKMGFSAKVFTAMLMVAGFSAVVEANSSPDGQYQDYEQSIRDIGSIHWELSTTYDPQERARLMSLLPRKVKKCKQTVKRYNQTKREENQSRDPSNYTCGLGLRIGKRTPSIFDDID